MFFLRSVIMNLPMTFELRLISNVRCSLIFTLVIRSHMFQIKASHAVSQTPGTSAVLIVALGCHRFFIYIRFFLYSCLTFQDRSGLQLPARDHPSDGRHRLVFIFFCIIFIHLV